MPVPGWQEQIVARPDGGSGAANAHAAWRLALAEQAARAYASNQKLAALTVAGSVGTVWPTGSLTWNRTATGSIRRVTWTAQAQSTCSAVTWRRRGTPTLMRRSGATTTDSADLR
jgi:hypothetical protein